MSEWSDKSPREQVPGESDEVIFAAFPGCSRGSLVSKDLTHTTGLTGRPSGKFRTGKKYPARSDRSWLPESADYVSRRGVGY